MTEDYAGTGVFWDVEDCPIPNGVEPHKIYEHVKSALADKGFHGEVSFSAYCENKSKILDDFHVHDIPLVPTGYHSTRFERMLKDILAWALNNPVDYPQTIPNLMLISKPFSKENAKFRDFIEAMSERNYNVLFAMPAAVSYVSSVWLWPSLAVGGNPIDELVKYPSSACVFWDVEDCPIPDGVDPDKIYEHVKSAIADKGYVGEVSFSAYCDKNKILDDFKLHDIPLVPAGDKSARLNKMMIDIFAWALNTPVHYPKVTPNVMVISKDISETRRLIDQLQILKTRDYNILLALSDAAAYVSSVWLWSCLVDAREKREKRLQPQPPPTPVKQRPPPPPPSLPPPWRLPPPPPPHRPLLPSPPMMGPSRPPPPPDGDGSFSTTSMRKRRRQ